VDRKKTTMFKKLMVTALGLMMILGVMGINATTASADPGKSLSKENMLVVTVVAYGKSRSIEPEMVAMTKDGRYAITAKYVGKRDSGKQTYLTYVARNLPWGRTLYVDGYRAAGLMDGKYVPYLVGNKYVRFEKNFRDYRVTMNVHLKANPAWAR
jgi:hypothetical protein